ncbi:hypothetical protein BXZ70DRAFT_12198 [Cristinia sonorae]|uniref:MYND-type domain-containing protein n=1 Tax=Cristinia sonorae TaxID=1940300 RepID=A0A8K0UZV9_9AGAR|nr:hypothetical protein BXZ70DRAFT_12198 [Cristinia sonorae]
MSQNNKKSKGARNTSRSNSTTSTATSSNDPGSPTSPTSPRNSHPSETSTPYRHPIAGAMDVATRLTENLNAQPIVRQYMESLSPDKLAEFVANMTVTAQRMGGSMAKWPQIMMSKQVARDGVGSDLVELTDLLWPDPVTRFNRLNFIHETEIMNRVPEQVAANMAIRGKGGLKCERPGCDTRNPDRRPPVPSFKHIYEDDGSVEEVEENDTPPIDYKPVLKRCGTCHQVSYCSRECQKADWRRHKQFCQAIPKFLTPTQAKAMRDSFALYARGHPRMDCGRILSSPVRSSRRRQVTANLQTYGYSKSLASRWRISTPVR